ncbi:hypothetical protein VTO73DRAFT_5855 [Trametes versicolor]
MPLRSFPAFQDRSDQHALFISRLIHPGHLTIASVGFSAWLDAPAHLPQPSRH